MNNINFNILENKKKIHFIGVGGSGMYPIVQILHGLGYEITGSDISRGTNIDMEIAMGLHISLIHEAKNVHGADLVVFSAAIAEDNPELKEALALNIPIIERSEMLGVLTSWFKNCICVSGTHGKTSTTSMITHMLMKTNKDPSAVIGGKLPVIGGNGRYGKSENMVCEACEFKDTFLYLRPDIAVILNIDEDHMDYFKNMDNLISSFNEFAKSATKVVVINGDDENSHRAVIGVEVPVITFGLSAENDYYAKKISLNGLGSTFVFCKGEEELCEITLNVPGIHNVSNALCACVAAVISGVEVRDLPQAIFDFRGAGRRFEVLGEVRGIMVVDDFAHHPVEIEATLNTAKELGFKEVWAVFQPYTYSRTALLLDDFVKALSLADHVIMTEIVSARENNIYNVYTEDLVKKLPGSVCIDSFKDICDYVLSHAKSGDLVVTMGGGDIYKCAAEIMSKSQ